MQLSFSNSEAYNYTKEEKKTLVRIGFNTKSMNSNQEKLGSALPLVKKFEKYFVMKTLQKYCSII